MDKLERIAKRVCASKNVRVGEVEASGTHVIGKLFCSPDDADLITEYEFSAAEKAFQRYFDVFRTARKSVLVKTKPVVYYSTSRMAFYCVLDFDALKDASYSDEERIEEINALAEGVE